MREKCHISPCGYVKEGVRDSDSAATCQFIRMHNRHLRVTCATPEQLVALVSDFDAIWPRSLAPPPRRLETGVYEAPPMIWKEIARPGAIRAFHVTWPEELDAQHWFELQPVDNATVLRHVIDGRAFGAYMAIWTDKIEPRHNLILEALLDNVEAAVA